MSTPDVCEWKEDSNPDWELWESSCGHSWICEEGTPASNGMVFCPFCGKPLKEVPYVKPKSEEEEG